jgi:hypothetical protein
MIEKNKPVGAHVRQEPTALFLALSGTPFELEMLRQLSICMLKRDL